MRRLVDTTSRLAWALVAVVASIPLYFLWILIREYFFPTVRE